MMLCYDIICDADAAPTTPPLPLTPTGFAFVLFLT